MPIPADTIQEIMDNFDFDAVHKYIVHSEWRWWDGKGPHGTPTKEQLRARAMELLEALEHARSVASYGFYARRTDRDAVELHFTIQHTLAYI